MEIKRAKDIIKYRNYLLKKLEIYYQKLDKLSTSPFTNLKEKRILKENISNLRYELDNLYEFVYNSTHFKSSEFALFLQKFLSLTEPKYKVTEIKVADSIQDETLIQKIKRERSWKQGIRINNVKGKWCYFISDKEERKLILDNIFDEDDLENYISDYKKNDVLILDDFYTLPFDKNVMMKKDYRKNKRIKTAIYELIDLKIKQPELTDEERLQKVLENTVRRNLNKSYSKEYQKKKSK